VIALWGSLGRVVVVFVCFVIVVCLGFVCFARFSGAFAIEGLTVVDCLGKGWTDGV